MSSDDRIKNLEDRVQYLESILLKQEQERAERFKQKQKSIEEKQKKKLEQLEKKRLEKEHKTKEREETKKLTKKEFRQKLIDMTKTLDPLSSTVFNDFHLTGNILKQGINGIINYLVTGPLRNRYLCIDPSHHVFVFKTQNDKIFQDVHAATMISWFIQANKDIFVEILQELKDITNDNCNLAIANDLYDLLMGNFNKIFLQELSVSTVN